MKGIHFIAALLPLLGCSHNQTANVEDKPLKPATVPIKVSKEPAKQINFSQMEQREFPAGPAQTPVNKKAEMMLDVPIIKQNPELKYGCEVTSLAMVLRFAGVNTSKMELFNRIKKDADPLVRSRTGDIIRWGNPAEGFVGDMTGNTAGYAVFDKPMEELVNHYLPGRAVNLTNKSFDDVLAHVSKGFPVVVWTTGDFRMPDRWESWRHGTMEIKTPLDLHAVVLVGYDHNFIYLNDPLSGGKQVKVNRDQFIASWKALQSRAISYN